MSTTNQTLERKDEVQAPSYCVKCKANRPIGWSAVVKMKNGRTAAKGRCRHQNEDGSECGTGAYTFNGGIIKQVCERIAQLNPEQ